MGRRGRKSSAPSGYGCVTVKGYRQILHDGRRRMEQRVVWEENNGPVPEGYRLHHLNGDRLDNRLENLVLVRRGCKSSAPGGYGCVVRGYRRVFHGGRPHLEHRLVWEKANGPIPEGYLVHHINGDRLDNRLKNLVLVTLPVHRRIHTGCEWHEGRWWKLCRACGIAKPVDLKHWYLSAEGWQQSERCRLCYNIWRRVEGKGTRRGSRLPKSP